MLEVCSLAHSNIQWEIGSNSRKLQQVIRRSIIRLRADIFLSGCTRDRNQIWIRWNVDTNGFRTDFKMIMNRFFGSKARIQTSADINVCDLKRAIRVFAAIFHFKAIIVGALGYLISPIDVIPDAIPIAGLTDDLSVLIYVINKVWNNVGDDVKQKAHERLKTWFDEEELKAADDLFTNNPMDNPV